MTHEADKQTWETCIMKLDNIELFTEEINRKDFELIQKIRKKDILLIERRFKIWENGGWDDFVRMAQSDDNCEAKVDFTPIKILCRFVENCGDPLIYLKAMSVSYPDHAFCQMLIGSETVTEFLTKLKPLEVKVPQLFQDNGKKWLSELFKVSKGFVREEHESEIQSTAYIADTCA